MKHSNKVKAPKKDHKSVPICSALYGASLVPKVCTKPRDHVFWGFSEHQHGKE